MIVKYSKKFPYAPYLNEDIGFEMEVKKDDPQTLLDTLDYLKSIAEKFHKDNNPGLHVEINPEYQHLVQPMNTYATSTPAPLQSIDPKKRDLEEVIQDVKTIEELEWYVEGAEHYGLMDLYNQKLSSLK